MATEIRNDEYLHRLLADGGGNISDTNPLAMKTPDGKNEALGATDDSMVDAGDAGSVSAKLRRLTKDIDDVKTAVESLAGLITDGAIPTKATLTGHTAFYDLTNTAWGARRRFGRNSTIAGAEHPIPASLANGRVTFWVENMTSISTRNKIRLEWYLDGEFEPLIVMPQLDDLPSGATLGVVVGGPEFESDDLLWVPNYGGNGVAISIDLQSQATGQEVRVLVIEEALVSG